jgi:hypothetical protein
LPNVFSMLSRLAATAFMAVDIRTVW